MSITKCRGLKAALLAAGVSWAIAAQAAGPAAKACFDRDDLREDLQSARAFIEASIAVLPVVPPEEEAYLKAETSAIEIQKKADQKITPQIDRREQALRARASYRPWRIRAQWRTADASMAGATEQLQKLAPGRDIQSSLKRAISLQYVAAAIEQTRDFALATDDLLQANARGQESYDPFAVIQLASSAYVAITQMVSWQGRQGACLAGLASGAK